MNSPQCLNRRDTDQTLAYRVGVAKRLSKAAVALNQRLGDPTIL
jgi:hypothetical protein